MPGAYTHITIARLLTSSKALKDQGMPEARKALLQYPEFCHMGAISPDYPYLKILDGSAELWANAMHHKYITSTEKNTIHVGISRIRKLTGDKRSKCLSWFLGFVSHVIADVTCHPVTNLLVGDYDADNQVAHRESELHQDVYIFKNRLNGDVRKSEHIKNVIGSCADPDDKNKVDPDIERMWNHMLSKAFPTIKTKSDINIHGWHHSVQVLLDGIAEEISVIPSRHIRGALTGAGLAYPRMADVDQAKFINKLKTPNGAKSYDQIFNYAKKRVVRIWKLIADGIFMNNDAYKEIIHIWNLDSGEKVKTAKVMWEKTI